MSNKKIYFWFPILISLCCSSSLSGQLSRFHKLRTWTDSSGKHKTEAMLISSNEVEVNLALQNGESKTLPFERLSQDDQEFIEEYGSENFTEIKNQARNSVFAADALKRYEEYSSSNLVSPANQVFVDSQIQLLKEKSESNSIIINSGYLPLDQLSSLKAQSLADANEWAKNIASAGKANEDQKLIKKAISDDPTSLESAITLGLWFEVGVADYKAARRHLERAIERGERYLPIATETDRQNLLAAMNNLAVSYAKQGKISKAIKLMGKMEDVSEADLPKEVSANVGKIKRMIMNTNSGLAADSKERKTVAEFSNLIGGNSTSSAWHLMVPQELSTIQFAIDKRFSLLEGKTILDKRCIRCDGTTTAFCPVKECKKGAIKKTIWGPKMMRGKVIGREIKTIKYDPCTNCKGKGVVNCSGCYSPGKRRSIGIQN